MTREETNDQIRFKPSDHSDRYDAEGHFMKLTAKTEIFLTELKCNLTDVFTGTRETNENLMTTL